MFVVWFCWSPSVAYDVLLYIARYLLETWTRMKMSRLHDFAWNSIAPTHCVSCLRNTLRNSVQTRGIVWKNSHVILRYFDARKIWCTTLLAIAWPTSIRNSSQTNYIRPHPADSRIDCSKESVWMHDTLMRKTLRNYATASRMRRRRLHCGVIPKACEQPGKSTKDAWENWLDGTAVETKRIVITE
jgi:hypothetical protein